jgi:hypothetical protein
MKTTISQNLIFRTFSRLQRSCFSAVFLLLFLLSASITVQGQTAASATWALTADANATVSGNVTANSIAIGSGINTPVYGTTGISTSSWVNDASSRQTNEYYEYKVSPTSGNSFNFTSISGEHSRNSGNWIVAAFYSLNNFSSETQIGSNTSINSSTSTTFSFTGLNISVPIGATLTVRIYAWESDGAGRSYRNKNIVISGTTSCVPTITSQSTAAQSKCINTAFNSISVTAAGTGLTYQWYHNNSNSTSGGTSLGSANGAQTATYTPQSTVAGTKYYYCIVSNGCGSVTSSVSGAFTVTNPPSAGTLSGTQTLCSNGSTTLSSTVSGGTWTSASTSKATVNSSSGVVSGVAAGTSIITYTVAGTGGCSAATANLTVTVTALPSAGTLAGTQTICSNGTTQLSSTVSGGTWSSGSTGVATIDGSSGVVTPVSAGSATMTYNVTSNGCSGSATREITVNTSPTVNAGSDFNLCSGQTIALSGSTDATGPTLSGTANSGTVTVSGNDNTNPTATYTFTGLPSGAVINGITVNISSAGGGNCPSWYSVTTRLNGVQQGVAGCATNTTYTNLNGQDANGLVVAVIGQDNDDYGDAMTITYTVTLNYTYFGNPTYAWSPATGLSSTNELNPTCSTTSTQTYTLTVTGGNGCSASDQVVATVAGGAVPTTPTAAVTGTSTINVGGTVVLTSTAGANTVWYTTETGGSSVGTGSPFTTPVQCTSGTVTYYAEEDNGNCTSNARGAVTFTVRPLLVSNPANALICQDGGSVTLSAQLTGASGITWSPNTNLSTTSGASTVASPTTTTIYTMSATVAGCGSVSAMQTVGVIDAVAFTPTSTPASVCAGNPVELASNLSNSNFSASCTTVSNSLRTAPGNAVTLISNNALTVSGSLPSGVSVNSSSLDDNFWSGVPIGFTYNYFGDNATSVFIGTNGTVVVNVPTAVGSTQYDFTGGFPNEANPAATIAVCARDLRWDQNATGSIKYWTEGIAPTRKFIVQYSGGVPYSGDYSGRQDAELVLNETTGIVEIYVIRATNNGSTTNNSRNKYIGLQDKSKAIGATSPNCSTNAINYWNGVTDQITTGSGQAWKFIPGADYTFQWATAGSNIDGASSSTYTTPALDIPGTVTYNVAATNPNTQCTTTQSVNITVNALPAAPNSSGDVTACSTGGNQSLTVSTGAGETADWFAASTGGTVLASGDNVLSYSTATAGTYYAAAQNTTTGCSSASRTGVTLTVNTSPAAPTVSTPVSYCQGATATALTATATGANTLNWYSAAPSYPAVTGATALGSAPTPSTSTAGTTNYYVSQSSSSNSCESELALVAVTVNATPSAPVASNPAAYCQGATASALTATSTAGNTLYWYTVPTGGTGSSTAPTPSTATAGTTDYYVADRNNSSSCEGSRTTVTVTVNPTITASVSNSASSTSACGGGAITFTATPTNGGTPTYQWYLNNNPVGTSSATYTLSTPNNADAIYVEMTPSAQTCLASSAATNSNTVTLTSTAATPTVSIQSSASSAFCPGTSVTFSVSASANMGASPSYQWNLNGSPISGETNATLTTSTLVNNDQVTLTMTSSLSGGCLTQSSATSSAITSAVNNATAISTQPAAAAACLGGSQSFTVSATGTGTLTYQWKKNDSNVTGNATATSSTLTLSGIAAGDAANYTVDVTGTCGTVTSTVAALTINSATTISTQPSAVSQCAGTTANFSVTASGQGTLTYQWRKDGSALDGETNATLAVTNISMANAGQYSVIVSGGCGNVTSSNALLTVNSATVISTQPSASTLCAGNTANFSVTASGTGILAYQWKKDGSNVGTNSSTLSIINAQAADAGTYTVDVTGTCGAVSSSNAVLVVNALTTITTQPVSMSSCQGQSSTFTVVATGTSPLAYQWNFGGVNISGATAASYTIPTATIENDGAYFVTVTGGCGAAVNSNTVTMVVNSIDTPTFTQVEAICYGTNLSALPTTSNNGIAGTWSPALNNTATTTYTFTPTAGQCATTTTMTITVNSLPGSATSSNVTVCVTGSVTLTADNPGAGYTINWYNAAQDTQLETASLTYTTSISATTSYFAEIENTLTGCKSENRTEVQAILNSTNFWVGGYTGQPNKTTDWFTEQNWSCGTVPNATTNVVIPDGKTVSIDYRPNQIGAAAYTVTLQGNASLTVTEDHNITVTNKVTVASGAIFTVQNNASLVQITENVVNEGNITVIKQTPSDRPLYIYDAVMWSSPVTQKLKAMSTNTPDSFYMEHAPLANAWSAVANPTETDFTKGKGYLVRTPMDFSFTQGQQWTVNFSGVPNNGAITYNAGNMDSTERFLLVGNPYPSAISIEQFKAQNPNITGVFYFYRKPNSATDITGYGTLTTTGTFLFTSNDNNRGSQNPGSVIPSGQAFFVRMKANSGAYTNDGKIYFYNTMRVADNHGRFNRINTSLDMYRLLVHTPTTGNNQLIVNYDSETTVDYDMGADAPAFTDGSTDLSSIMNTKFYRIQARGEYNVADVVPLRFKTGVSGEHRIKLQDAQGVFAADQMVIIKDNLTGVQHNLTANGDYVFTATAGTFTNRFEVVYQQAYYTALQANSCGATIANMNSLVYADLVNGATGYRFKVVNNTTSALQTIDRPQHWFAFNMLSSYDYNTPYTISVQVQKDGVWTGYYGASCTVNSPNIAATGIMQINPSQCGMTLPTIGTVIATTPVAGATGYKFRITNTTANASGANMVQEITRSNHWFTLGMLSRYNYGSSYTVEVAVKTTGAFTPYGNACTVYSPSAPTLASCGQTVATATTLVRTTAMTLATQYRFQVTRMSTQETITFDTANYWFSFRVNVPGYAAGEQYGVRVAVMTAGAWSPYGDACDITAPIASARTTEEASPSEANLFKPVAYPNPFASTFGISLATPSADVVHVMVYDLQGRLIEKQNVFVSQLDSLLIGTNYPSGDYLLVVAQGANIKSSHIHKD